MTVQIANTTDTAQSFKLNPDAFNIDCTVYFDFAALESLGWDFDEYYTNRAENMAEKAQYASYEAAAIGAVTPNTKTAQEYLEEATALVQSECLVAVQLRSQDNGPVYSHFALFNVEGNEAYGWEQTGDDEKTLEDVIFLLNAGEDYTSRANDDSEDKNGDYVPTFILC